MIEESLSAVRRLGRQTAQAAAVGLKQAALTGEDASSSELDSEGLSAS